MQNKNLDAVLIELSTFFKELCSKDASIEDFETLHDSIVLIVRRPKDIFFPYLFGHNGSHNCPFALSSKSWGSNYVSLDVSLESYISNHIYLFQNINRTCGHIIKVVHIG